jgi:undecaprenyl-diphosphatase
MMLFLTILLSVTQGITEFLPISSSAHLLLLPWLFGFPNPGLGFDAAIHIGTAAALLVFFGKEFYTMAKKRDKLLGYVLLASIPAGLIGFFGDKFIETHFHQASYAPLVVGIGMVLFSFVMYIVDKKATLTQDIKHVGLKRALFIGFAQALALIPGTSRSGSTIVAGEFLGLNRESAARFSFLMATPISLGAGLYKFSQLLTEGGEGFPVWLTVVGIITSFIVGLAVIKWLLDYLKKHTLGVFVAYRIALGLLVIGVWLWRYYT